MINPNDRNRRQAGGGARLHLFMREGEHAAGALLQPHDRLFDAQAFRLSHGAEGEDLFRAALRIDGVPFRRADADRHVLRVGREGVQVGNFRLLAQFFIVGAAAAGGDEQRPLGGVAHKADGASLFI